jgi:hypothetical protein
MIVVDHPSVVKNRQSFSARGAAILGMSNFGRAHSYILNDADMSLALDRLTEFVDRHRDGPVFLFGFTFMVWKYFIKALAAQGRSISLPHGILVHSGGWKKLTDEAVSNDDFKREVARVTGITRIHNFYGMVEQVGSVFVECEEGHLHAPAFADVIVRRPHDWSEAAIGEEGIVQVISCLPHSYPGHALLTEDRGVITQEDTCPCGRRGRTIQILGRLPQAEVRGCSDTHQQPSVGVAA